ncbi:MAG TPA: protein kinase, partial [Myxococcota bacterium]
AGAMGRVYRAQHATIGRNVALKVLNRDRAENPLAVERFFAEAQAVNRIRHAGIVEVTDLFTHAGTSCIVMELLEGHTLTDAMSQRLSPAQAVAIAAQIADALAAAHAAGVVHRDLKPDNVFLVDGAVKVLDFGVAKLSYANMPSGKTAEGTILGTPAYMAPEQLSCKPVDERVDVYALGVVLYQMVTGSLPFTGDSFGELVVKHLTVPPRPARTLAQMPAALDALILAMLGKDPAQRPQSMREVKERLARVLDAPTPARARPAWRHSRITRASVAAACVLGAALAFEAQRSTASRTDDVPAAHAPVYTEVAVAPRPPTVDATSDDGAPNSPAHTDEGTSELRTAARTGEHTSADRTAAHADERTADRTAELRIAARTGESSGDHRSEARRGRSARASVERSALRAQKQSAKYAVIDPFEQAAAIAAKHGP